MQKQFLSTFFRESRADHKCLENKKKFFFTKKISCMCNIRDVDGQINSDSCQKVLPQFHININFTIILLFYYLLVYYTKKVLFTDEYLQKTLICIFSLIFFLSHFFQTMVILRFQVLKNTVAKKWKLLTIHWPILSQHHKLFYFGDFFPVFFLKKKVDCRCAFQT